MEVIAVNLNPMNTPIAVLRLENVEFLWIFWYTVIEIAIANMCQIPMLERRPSRILLAITAEVRIKMNE